jgi:hypothetical protein
MENPWRSKGVVKRTTTRGTAVAKGGPRRRSSQGMKQGKNGEEQVTGVISINSTAKRAEEKKSGTPTAENDGESEIAAARRMTMIMVKKTRKEGEEPGSVGAQWSSHKSTGGQSVGEARR